MAGRLQEQNETAELAARFNDFYVRITLPGVSQIGNYEIVKEIGEGAFGKVYLARHILLHADVVLKCGAIDDPNLVREIYYHQHLKHRNIVTLYEVIKTELHLWIALEYCEGGELYYYIYEKRVLSVQKCRHLFYQMVDAVRYVHLLNLAHRDLKLENILLADNKKTVVKLTDFGFVREFDPYKRLLLLTVCGTSAYMAPEMLSNDKYLGFAVDIWLLGVILFAMLHGELPFDDDNDAKLKEKIISENPRFGLVPRDAVELLERMLDKDPQLRITLSEIFNSLFLIDVTNAHEEGAARDTELILSIGQHYRETPVPFQTKIERLLLKKLNKLHIDTELLQDTIHGGHTNTLTALYELALAREYRKKKYRHTRRYDARRQYKRLKRRVRSALSLTDQNALLDRMVSHLLNVSLRNEPRLLSRRSTDTKRLSNGTAFESAPLERTVLFVPNDRASFRRGSVGLEHEDRSRRFLGKLRFWKRRNRDDDDEAAASEKHSISDAEPKTPLATPSPTKAPEKPVGLAVPRVRPGSVVSQSSQPSFVSQQYAMSESEADGLDCTDDDDFLDDDGMYDLLLNNLQTEMQRRRRPPHHRALSDTLIATARKRYTLMQILSNSSDELSVRVRLDHREEPRPLLPRAKKLFGRHARMELPEQLLHPTPVHPGHRGGGTREHSPPIFKKMGLHAKKGDKRPQQEQKQAVIEEEEEDEE